MLKERHFAQAVEAAASLRRTYPENRDVLYLLALGQRHMHRTTEALETRVARMVEDLERGPRVSLRQAR